MRKLSNPLFAIGISLALFASNVFAEFQWTDASRKMMASVTKQLEEGLNTLKQMQNAPEKSVAPFGKDKAYYQSRMAVILGKVSVALDVSDINVLNEQIKTLNKKMEEEESKISALREKAAFGGKNVTSDIKSREDKVDAYSRQIGEIKEKLRAELERIGVVLDDDQLESLLTNVIADDFISMSIIFNNIGVIATKLGELMQNGNEDLVYAKKYYGMYMLLLQTLDGIQNDFINKIQNRYIPAINRIKREANLNIQEAKAGITSKRGNEETLTRNINSNTITIKAADLYLKQLTQQRNSIKAKNDQVRKDLFASQNTLKTVNTSFEMYGMMKKSMSEFNQIANIAPPQFIKFDNKQIEQEFTKMTATIKNN